MFTYSVPGLDPKLYAGNSFRRARGGGGGVGSASFAYQSGIPIELIKALGDWLTDTILIYLTMPLIFERFRSFDRRERGIKNYPFLKD